MSSHHQGFEKLSGCRIRDRDRLQCSCSGSEVAISTINAARHQRLTEEFVPFLAIYYYLSQFIDCPSGDSSIAATVVQRRRLKSPPTDRLSLAAFVVDLASSAYDLWPHQKLKVYQIYANFVHRELRNASFEGKNLQPQLKGRTLIIRYQLYLLVHYLPSSLARLFSMKVPISPHNTYDYATLAAALQMNCVKGRGDYP